MRGAWSVTSRSGIPNEGRSSEAQPVAVRTTRATSRRGLVRRLSTAKPYCRASRATRDREVRKRHVEGEPQIGEIAGPADLDGAQRGQVRGHPLHVDEPTGRRRRPQQVDEADQGHLRRVAVAVEHRLAGEQAADGDAVQPADQRGPRAHASTLCAQPELVQPRRRRRGCRGGSSRPADATVGAGARPRRRTPCRPGSRSAGTSARSDRLTRSPSIGRTPRGSGDHQPIGPAPPSTGIGKTPDAVRREQRARLEVAADPDQVLAVGQPVGVKR